MASWPRPMVAIESDSAIVAKIYLKNMMVIRQPLTQRIAQTANKLVKQQNTISTYSPCNEPALTTAMDKAASEVLVANNKQITTTLSRRQCGQFVMCAIPCVLGACIYYNSLNGQFVHDDLSAITTNNDVTGSAPTWDFLYNDFWGTALLDPRSHKSYRPLTVLTFK